MSNETKTGKCGVCGKPMEAVPGAKVYHFKCLYESLKEVRERHSG
jgi:hypothetical protein